MKRILQAFSLILILTILFYVPGVQINAAQPPLIPPSAYDEFIISYETDLAYYNKGTAGETGMLVPLMDYMKSLGLKVKAVPNASEYDIFAYRQVVDLKSKYMAVSDTVFSAPAFIAAKKDTKINNVSDLLSRNIGVVKGSGLESFINRFIDQNKNLKIYESGKHALAAVETGKVDCVVMPAGYEAEVLLNGKLQICVPDSQLPSIPFVITTDNDLLYPFFEELDEYLQTDDGKNMSLSILNEQDKALLSIVRENYKSEIAEVQRSGNVSLLCALDLYPYFYEENGNIKGYQTDINDVFKKITGVSVSAKKAKSREDLDNVHSSLSSGDVQAAVCYYNAEMAKEKGFSFSSVVWRDNFQIYTANEDTNTFIDKSIATTKEGAELFQDMKHENAKLYNTVDDAVSAVIDGKADVAFISSLAYEYMYQIKKDTALHKITDKSAPVNIALFYNDKNKSFNMLMDTAIQMNSIINRDSREKWLNTSVDYRYEKAKVESVLENVLEGIVFLTVLSIFGSIISGLLVLKKIRNFKNHDKQVAHMLNSQQNFDLVWGNIKKGTLESKGNFPIDRKYGVEINKNKKNVKKLSDVYGADVADKFAKILRKMKDSGEEFVKEQMELKLYNDQKAFYSRYIHYINDNEFMMCVIDETEDKNRELELLRIANTDYLSQLITRRAMDDLIAKSWENVRKGSAIRSFIVMFDIDKFKNVNDTYGHDMGDAVLTAVSKIIRATDGFIESTSRWGGEEFIAVVDAENWETIENKVTEILNKVENNVMHINGKDIKVTISAGIAMLDPKVDYKKSIMNADHAMYAAKKGGRNTFRIHGMEDENIDYDFDY